MPSPTNTAFLCHLGADALTAALLVQAQASAAAPTDPGRVTRGERSSAEVATPAGTVTATWDQPVCTGDWVLVTVPGPERDALPHVAYLQPRRTTFLRRSADENRSQVLATNIDDIWIVLPADRPVSPARLERTLILAWESGAEPVVVLSKSDVVSSEETAVVIAGVHAAGADIIVLPVSSRTGVALDTLHNRLGPGRTAALLGSSGAGKSSLVNALADADLMVGAVRAADNKGRHTTTWRELVVLPEGGALIDTPGLRSVGLWVDEGGLAATFSDITERAARCRFADCAHDTEPGCAVQSAIAEGCLERRRLDSYRKLTLEVERAREQREARAAVQQQRAGRARRRR